MDTSFEDFFSRICAKMDLDPKEAELGYKYHGDRARDPPHQLSNTDQLLEAFGRGCRLLKRARGRDVVLEIHNLVSFSFVCSRDLIELMGSPVQTKQSGVTSCSPPPR